MFFRGSVTPVQMRVRMLPMYFLPECADWWAGAVHPAIGIHAVNIRIRGKLPTRGSLVLRM